MRSVSFLLIIVVFSLACAFQPTPTSISDGTAEDQQKPVPATVRTTKTSSENGSHLPTIRFIPTPTAIPRVDPRTAVESKIVASKTRARSEKFKTLIEKCGGAIFIRDTIVQEIVPSDILVRNPDLLTWSAKGTNREYPLHFRLNGLVSTGVRWTLSREINYILPWRIVAEGIIDHDCAVEVTSRHPVFPGRATSFPAPTPVATVAPTPTPVATPEPTLPPTSTPSPTSIPTPTKPPLPTSTLTPTKTPFPTFTPTPTYGEQLDAAKQLMLELINEVRADAGVPSVEMGSNGAAQTHAENSLTNCFLSHWGLDGTTAGMRYALAGGGQVNGENISGLNYCPKPGEGYLPIKPFEEVASSMDGFVNSPGHRRTLLDPHYRKVNIGIAWDSHSIFIIQQFEGDFIRYEQPPVIQDGSLILEGSTVNGATLSNGQTRFNVDLYYHPFGALTRGQVARTYCLDPGTWAASILSPPLPGSFYSDLSPSPITSTRCRSPFSVSETAPPPKSYVEAKELHRNARSLEAISLDFVPWVVADKWQVDTTDFHVSVNIAAILDQHGPGVYRIVLWGIIGEEQAVVGDYPIFHEVATPTGYSMK